MARYINPNQVTIADLIEMLQTLDPESIVINDRDQNINVYPGRENKPGGRPIVKLC